MTASTERAPSASPSATLCELGVLGVQIDGAWTGVSGQRTSVLLAALGLAGNGGVGTEELVEMIWPSPGQPATARQSLANIVLRLRRSYGASFVESTRRGYRIGSHVQSEREQFLADVANAAEVVDEVPDRALELVERALSRWRDEPWLGIERPVGVEADRANLLRMHIGALRTRATALMSLDRDDLAVPVLREILVRDPYDELVRYRLVRILGDSGQRAQALRTIREAGVVFSERGLVVDAALADVEQRLLSAAFASNAEMEPLPEQFTDIVGRQREIDEIADALRASRLVTLHGIGGSGKTRLAIHVASTSSEPEKCGFVDLAGARSRAQVELAFARGLGLPVHRLDGLDPDERLEALANASAPSSGVLVIDNCEHVLGDARAIVTRLIAQPGRLRMLATSRVPLDITGEYRFPIPQFAHATELFRQRSAQRGVTLRRDQQSELVARICELVDHLPLAVGIAAAQTPYRTLHEIADELGRGIEYRDATQGQPRHETMASAIRWSHELLDTATADALMRLGVFHTPFQHSDAAAVIESDDTSSVLDALVRASLIERSDDDGRSAYRLSVPVQQYCAAELERRRATTEVLVALADWLLEFTDRPYGDVWWRVSAIDEIEPRLPHALSAIAALRSVGRVDAATRLASRLGGAARHFGHADELIELLTELWPHCDDAESTSDALVALAECADAARRDEVFDPTLGLLASIEGPVGRRHSVYVHCEHSLWLMWAARLTDADYGAANEVLRRARDQGEALASPINRAHIEHWQSGVHLLDGAWEAAGAAARRALEDSGDTVFDLYATSCLCHALLQLDDPEGALELATGHPLRNRDNPHGDLLGIVAAIARIRNGETDAGLSGMSYIQLRARHAPYAIQQDDAAIAIAYIAHILHHADLTIEILETGVVGYGPWVGYLVPKICRDTGIQFHGHCSTSFAERQERSDFYGTVASGALEKLRERHARHGEAPPDGS